MPQNYKPQMRGAPRVRNDMKKKLNYSVISYQAEMANEAWASCLRRTVRQAQYRLMRKRLWPPPCRISAGFVKFFRRKPPVLSATFIRRSRRWSCAARERDLEALCGAAESFKERVTQRYSVQCRILGKHDGGLAPFDINSALSAVLAASEQECDVKTPCRC